MSFSEAMKSLGIDPGRMNLAIHGIDLESPVYVTTTRYNEPFKCGAAMCPAGQVTTVTNAINGEVLFTEVPVPIGRKPLFKQRP